ncbi:hypothetical protein HMF8227_01703 [Saliniradius amylolyticus]|uniref:HPt domain-containing protein n=1 Tax=Saliniradius amylolyticus TaxID=2183582 RepID=A0A2S2E3D8_9ALTE|nr:Hpt domain-containing protein [Saliniradius amylolyticus]AWL12176.1 hypothetical protein HMF8227_01703 [Saliniradius amylolyticus]
MTNPVPTIDIQQLSYYTGDLSSDEFIFFIEEFRTTLEERGEMVINHGRGGDWQQVDAIVHNLKTNTIYIGAEDLHQKCLAGEKLFRSAGIDEQQLNQWLEEFQSAHHRLMKAIHNLLKEYQNAKKARG